MDNRAMGNLEGLAFSPVKEDRSKAAMPPPTAAPPKAKKGTGNGANNKSSSAPSVKAAVPTSAPSRRDKLIKWKEEKEMKRKQMASKAKPQVFKVSKALDHKEDANLFMSSKNKTKSAAKPAAKPVNRPAPVPQRSTRSSTRSAAKPPAKAPTNGVKDTSRTRAPVKKVEPAPSTRTRRGPPPPPTSKPASSRMPSTRSAVSSDRAPSTTRQSARLATKPAPPQSKTGRTTRGAKVEKPALVVKKAAPVVEKVAPAVEKEEETVEEEIEEEENVELEVEPAKPVIDEATFNVNNQRGSSMLAETFGRPEGFTFSMAVPNLPFTPISPASASIFLFPTAKSNTALTPSQRRCSTPYSLRPLRSLGQQQEQGPIPPQPIMTEVEDFAMETDTSKPVETESDVKPETENMPETTENERTPMPQEEVAMETEDPAKAETDVHVQGEAVTGEPVERKPSESTDTSPVQEKDLQYFKNLVSSETTRLLDRCSIWEKVMSDNKLSEEVLGEIRSSIGKAKLLIGQRFKQFLGLVKDCEFGLGEKVTHCSDLEGFWEMIYFQVEDVDTLFKELEKLQANNWQREEKKVDKPKLIKKKKPVTKKPVGGEAAAKRIAARERLLAAKAAMQAKATRKAESEKVVFEGGFFKVESPARKATPAKTKELREDGLSRQALQNRTNIMASPASNLRSPALLKRTNIMASPASTLCSPALKKMTIMASPGSNVCSPALQSKRTKMMESPVINLCSPLRRKTRKSSMGFGLSKAASLFTPEKDTPEKGAPVQDLISWN